jgi:hypothetical protein
VIFGLAAGVAVVVVVVVEVAVAEEHAAVEAGAVQDHVVVAVAGRGLVVGRAAAHHAA